MTSSKIEKFLNNGMLSKSEAIALLNKQVKSDIQLEKDIHSFLFQQGGKLCQK